MSKGWTQKAMNDELNKVHKGLMFCWECGAVPFKKSKKNDKIYCVCSNCGAILTTEVL